MSSSLEISHLVQNYPRGRIAIITLPPAKQEAMCCQIYSRQSILLRGEPNRDITTTKLSERRKQKTIIWGCKFMYSSCFRDRFSVNNSMEKKNRCLCCCRSPWMWKVPSGDSFRDQPSRCGARSQNRDGEVISLEGWDSRFCVIERLALSYWGWWRNLWRLSWKWS